MASFFATPCHNSCISSWAHFHIITNDDPLWRPLASTKYQGLSHKRWLMTTSITVSFGGARKEDMSKMYIRKLLALRTPHAGNKLLTSYVLLAGSGVQRLRDCEPWSSMQTRYQIFSAVSSKISLYLLSCPPDARWYHEASIATYDIGSNVLAIGHLKLQCAVSYFQPRFTRRIRNFQVVATAVFRRLLNKTLTTYNITLIKINMFCCGWELLRTLSKVYYATSCERMGRDVRYF